MNARSASASEPGLATLIAGGSMAGSIRDRDFIRQIKCFDGLRFKRDIGPTDIDAFLDFGGRLFVFVETKRGDAPLPKGQRRALERLCDACATPGRTSVLLVTTHEDEGDIDLANTRVIEIREAGRSSACEGVLLRTVIDDLVSRYVPELASIEPSVAANVPSAPSRPGLRKTEPLRTPKKSSTIG